MSDGPLRVVVAGTRASRFPPSLGGDRVELTVASTEEELRTAVRSAEVLYSWRVPGSVPSETPDLRWIQLPSAGVDHIRALPVWDSPIVITAARGIHTVPMAEHLFAMILALTRQIAALVREQQRRKWVHDTGAAHLAMQELRGKTMGIIGWGKIGDGAAHLARAFGMRVIGTRWSLMVPREIQEDTLKPYVDPPWLPAEDLRPDVVYPAGQLHEVLSQSDVVVLILPLTDETRGSIGAAEFRAMKRGALLCNIGRGPVIDEEALIAALRTGRLAGAGLDVFSDEPLPVSSPLWSMPNVIVSPHVGGVSIRTADRADHLFVVNLTRYLDGEPLLNVVDRGRGY